MLCLLGAGFNIDANDESGPVINHYNGTRIDYDYPLVTAVLKLCFGLNNIPEGKSIEDLFFEALQARNYKPMEALVDRLAGADYYVAQRLARAATHNSYRRFFENFGDAQFLTFNYDSLPEIFLSQNGRWFPEDGYGIPVQTEFAPGVESSTNVKSSSLVIHLHGSACVFTIEPRLKGNPAGGIAELIHLAKPLCAFDPDSTSGCFPRYGRVMSIRGRARPDQRVIAPIPDKREDLKQAFIQKSYSVALPLVRHEGVLVAVGYSFNRHDRASYHRILQALEKTREKILFLVSPQTGGLAKRISNEYPALKVRSIGKTFGQWAADSFRGL